MLRADVLRSRRGPGVTAAPCNVLFLCTGNSARSILAEAILNRLGGGRFRAYSAGSRPVGRVNRLALELLEELGHPVEGLYSKGWEAFARPGGPRLDLVVTVCDRAAGEVCPVWPGAPVAAHWPIADPAAIEGGDEARRDAFGRVHRELEARIGAFVAHPAGDHGGPALKERLAAADRAAPGRA